MLDPDALDDVPPTVGTVRLPEPFNPNSRSHQHDLVGQLRGLRTRGKSKRAKKRAKQRPAQDASPWKGTAANDTRRELKRVSAQISERKGRLATRFKSVVGLLTEIGYIDRWTLTDAGEMLLGTFHELDLTIVEALRAGHLDGHDPETLAGLVSMFVYEHRGHDDPPPPWYPNDAAREAAKGIQRCSQEVQRLESAYGLPESRDVDPGLVGATYGWASGGGLDDILGEELLTGGDFVRSMRQVIDILMQLAGVAPDEDTRRSARRARGLVERGIVDGGLVDAAGVAAGAVEADPGERPESDADDPVPS